MCVCVHTLSSKEAKFELRFEAGESGGYSYLPEKSSGSVKCR